MNFTPSQRKTLVKTLAPLVDLKLFLAWFPGPPDARGKRPKWPIDGNGNRLAGWQRPDGHLPLNEAFQRAERFATLEAGIGVCLHPEPIIKSDDGVPLYLTGLDVDDCVLKLERDADGALSKCLLRGTARITVEGVGSYAEVSPSGKGIRALTFTTVPFATQRVKRTTPCGILGLEIFGSSGWLTLTGNVIHDKPISISTGAVKACAAAWFPNKQVIAHPTIRTTRGRRLTMNGRDPSAFDETRENIQQVRQWLNSIGQIDGRDGWRDVVWCVMGLGWSCSDLVVREWASRHCHGYEHCWESGLVNVINSFEPSRAKGWKHLRQLADESINSVNVKRGTSV